MAVRPRGGRRPANGEATINTKILEYILAIAEEGSLSKAADRFFLSQPAMSMHLRHMEEAFGVPLFTRSRSKMELTRAGILFANNARLILHLQEQLTEDLHTLQQKQALHILADPPFHNFFVLEILPPFQAQYPDVHV